MSNTGTDAKFAFVSKMAKLGLTHTSRLYQITVAPRELPSSTETLLPKPKLATKASQAYGCETLGLCQNRQPACVGCPQINIDYQK